MFPDPHMHAYVRTDVHIAYSVVTKYAAITHQIQRIAKSCPGTHTVLQAPMHVLHVNLWQQFFLTAILLALAAIVLLLVESWVTQLGWFSMSPLPGLHHHDIMTIVGLFFIYVLFVTICCVMLVR